MKRIFVAVACLLAGIGLAMAATETIYLKNGSVIKGDIVEEVPGVSIKVKTADGSLFVYSINEVERITKEEASHSDDNGHRGLDFGINAGIDIMDGGSSIPVDLMVSKRFNKNVSLGVGAGVNIPTSGGDPSVPIFLDFKGYFPLKSTKLTPFVDVRSGYTINTASEYTVGSGRYSVTVTPSDFVMASVIPGIRIPMSSRTDVDFGLGYMMYAPTSGGGKITSAFALRLGLNFHKSTNPNRTYKAPIPTRNTGLELGFDAYGAQDLGLNLLVGYRLSKQMSVGFGFGYGLSTSDIKFKYTYSYYSNSDASGKPYEVEKETQNASIIDYLKFFIRGEYRLTPNDFSPYAAIDLGFRPMLYDPGIFIREKGEDIEGARSGLFMRPSVGISWRCTNNSYLQLHIDYELSNGGVKSYDEVFQTRKGSCRFHTDGYKFCPFSVGITWKHTLSFFSRD